MFIGSYRCRGAPRPDFNGIDNTPNLPLQLELPKSEKAVFKSKGTYLEPLPSPAFWAKGGSGENNNFSLPQKDTIRDKVPHWVRWRALNFWQTIGNLISYRCPEVLLSGSLLKNFAFKWMILSLSCILESRPVSPESLGGGPGSLFNCDCQPRSLKGF